MYSYLTKNKKKATNMLTGTSFSVKALQQTLSVQENQENNTS